MHPTPAQTDMTLVRDRIQDLLDRDRDQSTHASRHRAALSEWALAEPVGADAGTGSLLPVTWLIAEGLRQAEEVQVSARMTCALACIGRACWPYPRGLKLDVAQRLLLVDPPTPDDAVWAAERCIRNEAIGAVVMDGRGLGMTATRRLHLAARATGRSVVMGRKREELRRPSAASVRGVVCPEVSETGRPRWSVEVLHRKGLRSEGPRRRVVERCGAAMAFVVDAAVADGSVATPPRYRSAAIG
ncbi:MAG: hypothetical protein AAF823_00970 [Planctomycetota bacterium]